MEIIDQGLPKRRQAGFRNEYRGKFRLRFGYSFEQKYDYKFDFYRQYKQLCLACKAVMGAISKLARKRNDQV